MKKVVVTGGKGFIGSHLCRVLKDAEFNVIVIDLPEYDISSDNLEHLFEDAHAVFHLAALVSVPESIQEPKKTHDINVTGTLNMLEHARKAGVKKVVFASSAAVYGSRAPVPASEDLPHAPESPYGSHKVIGEHYCDLYRNLFGLNIAVLRFFNVYGPGQQATSAYSGVISQFLAKAMKEEPPIIFGDGEATRDFVHVSDVADALLRALDTDTTEPMNIGTGQGTTINTLASLICSHKPRYEAERPGDIKQSVAAVERARTILSWQPKVSLEEGIAELKRVHGLF